MFNFLALLHFYECFYKVKNFLWTFKVGWYINYSVVIVKLCALEKSTRRVITQTTCDKSQSHRMRKPAQTDSERSFGMLIFVPFNFQTLNRILFLSLKEQKLTKCGRLRSENYLPCRYVFSIRILSTPKRLLHRYLTKFFRSSDTLFPIWFRESIENEIIAVVTICKSFYPEWQSLYLW